MLMASQGSAASMPLPLPLVQMASTGSGASMPLPLSLLPMAPMAPQGAGGAAEADLMQQMVLGGGLGSVDPHGEYKRRKSEAHDLALAQHARAVAAGAAAGAAASPPPAGLGLGG